MRYGTAYLSLEADAQIFELAVRALAEGNSLRATARIVQIDKDTACDWLNRAAQHCRLVLLYLWRNLHVPECQLSNCPVPSCTMTATEMPGYGSPLRPPGT